MYIYIYIYKYVYLGGASSASFRETHIQHAQPFLVGP